jgi:hypothetical protein
MVRLEHPEERYSFESEVTSAACGSPFCFVRKTTRRRNLWCLLGVIPGRTWKEYRYLLDDYSWSFFVDLKFLSSTLAISIYEM